MKAKLIGALRQRLLRSRFDPGSRDSGFSEPLTIADAHLVMNSLNQLAAQFHARTGTEEPRLFATADYLRCVFQTGADEWVSVHQETTLLQSYVPLLAINRGLDCQLELKVAPSPENRRMVRRHLSCDLVNLLARALPSDLRPPPPLRLEIDASQGKEWAYGLRVVVRHAPIPGFVRRLESDVAAYCERMGVPPASFETTWHNTQEAIRWEVHVGTYGDRP